MKAPPPLSFPPAHLHHLINGGAPSPTFFDLIGTSGWGGDRPVPEAVRS